jgi:hypothetical protein
MQAKVWNQTSGFVVLGGNRKEAWVVRGAMCGICAGIVNACDSLDKSSDYEWHCTNEGCENSAGERTYDMEKPDWVEILK